jgi:hypothetical protein
LNNIGDQKISVCDISVTPGEDRDRTVDLLKTIYSNAIYFQACLAFHPMTYNA